jgi:aristolochene synthase
MNSRTPSPEGETSKNVANNVLQSQWIPLQHPHVEKVSQEVDQYFLENWNFPNEKARKTFLAADFSGVTCLYFPLAKDDRIHLACRLLTILFLVDGKISTLP